MPNSCKPHPSLPNVYVDKSYFQVLSAWIVVTEEERNANLRKRLCFPRRICMTVSKPISPIAEYQLRVASCAIDIAGKLYVISSNAEKAASSVDGTRDEYVWDDSRPHLSDAGPKITECVRLGQVVYQPRNAKFTVIEVADNFKVCRDSQCSECSVPINNNWDMNRTSSSGSEPVQLTIIERWSGRLGNKTPVTKYVIDLPHLARNANSETFLDYSQHDGHISEFDDLDQLSTIDSGGLISRHNQHIGIAENLIPGYTFARVLLFNDKLWAHLASVLNISSRAVEAHGMLTATRAWKHLEY